MNMEINKKQKVIGWIVVGAIIVTILIPPHKGASVVGLSDSTAIPYDCGFHIIGSGTRCLVNVAMLITEWIGILIVGGLAFFLTGGKKE